MTELRGHNDGAMSYELAVQAIREQQVRAGAVPPISDDERRQAQEGPRSHDHLDCVTGWKP